VARHTVVCTDLIDYGVDPTARYGIDFLKMTELPAGLKRVFVFRKRLPMMHRDGWEGRKANSGMAFAWISWERGYRGHSITRRISWEDDRDSPILLAQGRPVNGSQSRSHSLKRGANRAYVLARLRRDGRADLVELVETGSLSVRRALALITAHNPRSQRPPNGGAAEEKLR
jgi:hypothetical protein